MEQGSVTASNLQEWMHSKVHSSPEKVTEENLEHTPISETVSENIEKEVSESPKPSDVSYENKKTEEKPSSKKPEKAK